MSKKSKNGKAPKSDDAKRVKVSIPAELAEAIEAAGDSVEEVVERLLRDAHGQPTADKAKGKIANFLQDLAGPHLPQLEAIAKDVAAKVAKDVATAAAAAALTTFAAKAGGDHGPALGVGLAAQLGQRDAGGQGGRVVDPVGQEVALAGGDLHPGQDDQARGGRPQGPQLLLRPEPVVLRDDDAAEAQLPGAIDHQLRGHDAVGGVPAGVQVQVELVPSAFRHH